MSDAVMPPGSSAAPGGTTARGRRPIRFGLAARVLLLNTAFVIAAATIIYIPAIANYHDNWLRRRLSRAYSAALVLDAAPEGMVSPQLSRELLDSIGARVIVLSKHGTKQILASSNLPQSVDRVYDLRESGSVPLTAALATLMAPAGRVITAIGEAPRGGESIAITMDEAPLVKAMRAYSVELLEVALFMSLIVANLATIAIHYMVLRPVRRLTDSLIEFGANPENPARPVIIPSGGNQEIALAEEELAHMQKSLLRELNEKKHLADLGLAVAKISHDMRNMLTSAQLLSDRLANVADPLAQRLAPKLVGAIDRAVRFCQATLAYGRDVDDPPKLAPFALGPLIDETLEMVRLEAARDVDFVNAAPAGLEIVADREQMFRVLMNLVRNAAQALEAMQPKPGRARQIAVKAWIEDSTAVIEVSDTGPGVPAASREKLFTPFGSGRSGGSGLGLVIAADLVRGHGGTIALILGSEEKEQGAVFKITLPSADRDQP